MSNSNLPIIFLFVAFVLFGVLMFFTTPKVDTKRWDECITIVNKAIPDPNATEERSVLLKSCVER